MRRNDAILVMLSIGAVLLITAVKYFPYFPGDVAITRVVQSMTPPDLTWAQRISSIAKFPAVLILATASILVSGWMAGWRGGLAAAACFAGIWLVGLWLGPMVARPRPSSDLVRVAEKLSGSSFPSIFGLNFASTFGFLGVLFWRKSEGVPRAGVVIACCIVLSIGWLARVALGAHWPSDVTLSYLTGLLWAYFLLRFV